MSQKELDLIPAMVMAVGFFGGLVFGSPAIRYLVIHTDLLSPSYQALWQNSIIARQFALLLVALAGMAIALLIWIGWQSKHSVVKPNFWRYFWSESGKAHRQQWLLAMLLVFCGGTSGTLAYLIVPLPLLPISGFMGIAVADLVLFLPKTQRNVLISLMAAIVLPAILVLQILNFFEATSLHVAARLGYPGAILRWVPGVKVRASDRDGKTPLHYAARWNRSEAIATLLNHGADINATDKWGRTALHDAARYGSLQAVKTLVQSGADFQLGDKHGLTPAKNAARFGHFEIFRYLLTVQQPAS